MKQTATIKDVANYLGISASTVSRVMNGRDRVSPDMRKNVMEAVHKLNYVPNFAAVSIINKQTKLIVALVPDLHTPFFISVVEGIEEAAKKKGYYTLVYSTKGSRDEENRFLNGVMGRFADGVIVIPAGADLNAFKAYQRPVVLIERFNEDFDLDSVVIDNFRGAYTAAEHFIQTGHRKIAIISGAKDLNIGNERYWGFEQALRDNKIGLKPEYISIGEWTEKDGYAGAFRMIHLADPPTAIFAANDVICRGVIMAIHDLKLRLGQDISLIGFDDSDLAKLSSPPVTVISRATNVMGHIGVAMLLGRIENTAETSTPQSINLPTKLIVRGSVKTIS